MKIFLKKYPLLIAIALFAFVLRMYKINTALLDWHSFRQADTASVTRQFLKTDFNPLVPTYHDLSNIQSGQDNPNGYRMVEFPIYNIIVYAVLKVIPSLPLVQTSRVISSLFSIGTLISLFFLTRSYYGKKAGYLAAFFFAVLPYSVYYSRVIMPEPLMLFTSTFSILSFKYYLKKDSLYWYALSLLSLIVAMLLKPFVAFLIPVYIVMILEEKGFKKGILDFKLYFYAILAVIPFAWWRDWISNYPDGIPASDWLFNGPFAAENSTPRFKPFWFRWLFWERLTKLITGYVGVLFLSISFLNRVKNKELLIPAWWFGILVYFSVIATGNVRHDYYQIMTIPIICITLAHGVLVLDKFLSKKFNPLISISSIIVLIILMISLSFSQIKGYYNVNHPEYILAGTAADRLLPEDAKVIAPQFGDTAFIFQINRTGWPLGYDIQDKIDMGATHYVSTSYDEEAKELEEKFMIVEKTSDYMILDLTNKREKN
jgi:hypothetical protein